MRDRSNTGSLHLSNNSNAVQIPFSEPAMRRHTEYREPTFAELCVSIPTTLLLCLATPILIVISLVVSLITAMLHIRTIGAELVKFVRFAYGYPIACWGELFGDVKIFMVKTARVLFEATRVNPPQFIRRPQRKRKMPRLRPTKQYADFEYSPLGGTDSDIRLFVIPPAEEGWVDWEDGITGDLITVNLLTEPAYDALSYSWGSEHGDYSRSYRILISAGTPKEGVVWVTHNCAQAISRLRLAGRPRALWIDAICIDQKDLSERSHQVSIMAKIYTSATQVVAYTGRGSSRTDQLFDYLNSLDEERISVPTPPMPPAHDWVAALKEERKQPGSWLRSRFAPPSKNPSTPTGRVPEHILTLATDFFNLRYFTRVWTLQETILPSVNTTILICGGKSTSASRALHVLAMLQSSTSASAAATPIQTKPTERRTVRRTNYLLDSCHLPGTPPTSKLPIPTLLNTDLGQIFTLVRKRATPNPSSAPRSHLLDVLLATRNRNATDPRDRIFGILSIAWGMDLPHKFPSLYSVDYSLSPERVYTQYSELFILHYGLGFWLALQGWRGNPEDDKSQSPSPRKPTTLQHSRSPRQTRNYSSLPSSSDEEAEDPPPRLLPTWAGDLDQPPTSRNNRPQPSSQYLERQLNTWRRINRSWINDHALAGTALRDFPAAMRYVEGDDPSNTQTARFEDRHGDGKRVLILEGKRRVKRGRITRGVYGFGDGEAEEVVSGEEGGEVFVEVYRGLVLLLKKEEGKHNAVSRCARGTGDYYEFVQCCAHALTEDGARELVRKWGRVVVDGEGWDGQMERDYLGEMETFRII
ncbi:heterokaryon incompatibility protein-domain-containing protein [Cladorrhinum sp. PSN332]|nr:heterokaryon incompatibility protein-domain-containing protein [Cladorrhinum sp. PSN332]